jgi:hypothetical protein
MRKRQAQVQEHVACSGSVGTLEVETVLPVAMSIVVTFVFGQTQLPGDLAIEDVVFILLSVASNTTRSISWRNSVASPADEQSRSTNCCDR